MRRDTLFSVLLVLAIGAIFFSLSNDLSYMGYTVKDLNNCLLAKNKFEQNKYDFVCGISDTTESHIEKCTNKEESMEYEHIYDISKKWIFSKNGVKSTYIYDLKAKTCEKG